MFLQKLLGDIKEGNKKAHKFYGVRFNTEFVPAENLGVKNAKWDKEDGLEVSRDCYNSYFYPVEDEHLTVLDKIKLYRENITSYLDGGSALHLNLEQLVSKEQFKDIYGACATFGVNYWTTNTLCTICNDCGYINPNTKKECTRCHSRNVDYGTRIIGYLKREDSFSDARQAEAHRRFYS